jgi:hypothetical protein
MLIILYSSLSSFVADLERAALHVAAVGPEVVEQVKTELPAVIKFPETRPSYATVIGCKVTAVEG